MSDWTHLHPILIHFPIALLVTGLLFELLGRARDREAYRIVGRWNLYAGTVALALAVASGLLAEEYVEHDEAAHEIMTLHKQIGISLLLLFGSLSGWRILRGTGGSGSRGRDIFLALVIAGNLLLGYGAFLGGRLVYEYGVAVAPPAEEEGHQSGAGHEHGTRGAGHEHGGGSHDH